MALDAPRPACMTTLVYNDERLGLAISLNTCSKAVFLKPFDATAHID
jgi:hypothetical protein